MQSEMISQKMGCFGRTSKEGDVGMEVYIRSRWTVHNLGSTSRRAGTTNGYKLHILDRIGDIGLSGL